MLSSSPYTLGVIFVTLAIMWVLQMSLAKKQATGFLNAVNSIKGPGLQVAIGCLLYTSPSPRDRG